MGLDDEILCQSELTMNFPTKKAQIIILKVQ